MLFAIDIDQTVCGSNAHQVYARFHVDDLGLPIETSILNQLTSYRDFYFLPEVLAFRHSNEKEWNASRRRAIATPAVIEAFTPIDGAAEGVSLLSSHGTIRYYTARTQLVRRASQRWLKRYHFAHSQHVFCCESIEQKVMALADHKPYDEPIILVDDRGHTHFLTMLERMKEKQCVRELLQRLAILAFGTRDESLPETSLCPVFALPHWNALEITLHKLRLC